MRLAAPLLLESPIVISEAAAIARVIALSAAATVAPTVAVGTTVTAAVVAVASDAEAIPVPWLLFLRLPPPPGRALAAFPASLP
eukprot:COSAG05_NODE_2442_length_3057_cov_2.281324_3_plen_84_part_00